MWEGELLGRERVKSRSNVFDSNSVPLFPILNMTLFVKLHLISRRAPNPG